jgi:hypothetical protein
MCLSWKEEQIWQKNSQTLPFCSSYCYLCWSRTYVHILYRPTLNLRNVTSEFLNGRRHVCNFCCIMFMYVTYSAPNFTCLAPGIITCSQEAEINSRFVRIFFHDGHVVRLHFATKMLLQKLHIFWRPTAIRQFRTPKKCRRWRPSYTLSLLIPGHCKLWCLGTL